MQYRIAAVYDCEKLTRLRMQMRRERDAGFQEQALYAGTLAFFRRNIESGRHVAFVCEDVGQIVATAGLSLFEMPPTTKLPNGKVAKLMNMYVVPARRREGIGRAMLEFVVKYAREHGYHKVMLNASPMGERLYQSYGFTRIENEYEFYAD